MADPDVQVRGRSGHPHPEIKRGGGGEPDSKKFGGGAFPGSTTGTEGQPLSLNNQD